MAGRAASIRWVGMTGLGLLLAAISVLAQPPSPPKGGSQDPNRPKVAFTSVDLEGTYYRGKSRDTPCVLLVHKWSSDRTKSGWDELARLLQAEGFAVLTFDLRGHGGSTNVSPSFWTLSPNRNGILRANPKTQSTIDYKNFKPNYFPWVVNDLLSARRFLETKNDAGDLNAGSLFVVGAQEGASLGMEFVVSEWYRTYTVGFKALQSNGVTKTAGADIAGCVWLSLPIRPSVSTALPMRDWIRTTAGVRDNNPMCFIYGEKDSRAKADADELYRALTAGPTPRDKHKHMLLEIKGTDLAGQALLGPAASALGVPQRIVEYIKKVMAERRQIAWSEMEVSSNPLQTVNVRALGVSVP